MVIDQHRLDGLHLSAAAFTNLTHEHLDYHKSMDAYFAAKARLFEVLLPAGGTAVVNADSDRAPKRCGPSARVADSLLDLWSEGRGIPPARR
jgi:UDP-N-acetylmuramoyl-L-alanyl-D-glutamate--2,6-diaminopimelate ligase